MISEAIRRLEAAGYRVTARSFFVQKPGDASGWNLRSERALSTLAGAEGKTPVDPAFGTVFLWLCGFASGGVGVALLYWLTTVLEGAL